MNFSQHKIEVALAMLNELLQHGATIQDALVKASDKYKVDIAALKTAYEAEQND